MHYPFCLSAFSAGAQHLRYQVGFEVVLPSWFSRLPIAERRCYDFCFPTVQGRHLYMFCLYMGES